MEYRQRHPTDIQADWQIAIDNSKLNFEHLKHIDRLVKAEGGLLHRSFNTPVADGRAYYQITRIKKKTAVVKICPGICLDEYRDNILGDECEIPLSKAKQLVWQMDALARIFG